MKLTLVDQQNDIDNASASDIQTTVASMKKGDAIVLNDTAKGDRYFMQALCLDDKDGDVFNVEFCDGGDVASMKAVRGIDRLRTEALLQEYLKSDDSYKQLKWEPAVVQSRGEMWRVWLNLAVAAILTIVGIAMIISGEVGSGLMVTLFFGFCVAFCIFWLKMNSDK